MSKSDISRKGGYIKESRKVKIVLERGAASIVQDSNKEEKQPAKKGPRKLFLEMLEKGMSKEDACKEIIGKFPVYTETDIKIWFKESNPGNNRKDNKIENQIKRFEDDER